METSLTLNTTESFCGKPQMVLLFYQVQKPSFEIFIFKLTAKTASLLFLLLIFGSKVNINQLCNA